MSSIKPLLLADLAGMSEAEALSKVAKEFKVSEPDMKVKRLLIAYLEENNYDGSAWFLYVGLDDCLYEVNASHCSCYGFEDQWEPSLSSWTYLTSKHYKVPFYGPDKFNALTRIADLAVEAAYLEKGHKP